MKKKRLFSGIARIGGRGGQPMPEFVGSFLSDLPRYAWGPQAGVRSMVPSVSNKLTRGFANLTDVTPADQLTDNSFFS